MATRADTIAYLLDQLARAGRVSAKKMFGEYALYCEGKTVALVCDDQLFMKPTEAGRAIIGQVREGFPYPGAKPWFLIDGDRCEDADWLCDLVRATAHALPPPKPKAKKGARTVVKSKPRAKPKPKAKSRQTA